MDIVRIVAGQAIRFVAASQSAVALLMHGVWMLLLAGTTQAAGDGIPVARAFVKLFAWLGGIGPDGHGDEGHIVQAMALLTVPVYVVAAVVSRRGAPRPPFGRTLIRWAVASGAIAFCGFVLAFRQGGGLTSGEAIGLAALFAAIAAGATAWAVAVDRVCDLVASNVERGTRAEPARPPL